MDAQVVCKTIRCAVFEHFESDYYYSICLLFYFLISLTSMFIPFFYAHNESKNFY